MRPLGLATAFVLLLMLIGNGCGGGSTPPPVVKAPANTISVNFLHAPSALAVQIDAGNFAPASTTNGILTIALPNGTIKYAVAFVCENSEGTLVSETILEATIQDSTSYTEGCLTLGTPAPTGSATGNVDASAIPEATEVLINGDRGFGALVQSPAGAFNATMMTGMNDVAAIAVDASGNVLGVKMVRSQMVPGVLNNGSTIVLTPADVDSMQSLAVNNLPAGFQPPVVEVKYNTGNGTVFRLSKITAGATQYPAVPAAVPQAGDFYTYSVTANVTAGFQSMSILENTTSGGAATAISLPAPWTFAGPTPATLPVFTFNYTGFSGMASVTYNANLQWLSPNTIFQTGMIATASFQNGSATVNFPDLSSIPGFLTAPSGTAVHWNAAITGATVPNYIFAPTVPSNGIVQTVSNGGSYTAP